MLKRASWGLACLGLACLAVPALAAGPYTVNVAVVDGDGALLPNVAVTVEDATTDVAQPQGRSVWGFKTSDEMLTLHLLDPSLGSAKANVTMPAQAGTVFVAIHMSAGDASAKIVSEDEWPGAGGTWGPGGAVTSAAGTVLIELTAATPGAPDSPAMPLQGGDTCGAATVIASVPTSVSGTTSGYVNDYDEACPYTTSTAPDVVYVYTPAGDELVDVTLCVGTTNYDTKLYVYEDECVSPYYACNDDACSAPLYASYVSEITDLTLLAGHDYYIVVDGYGSSSGNYTLDISGGPPPTGACCVDQVCVATNLQVECDALGGMWFEGETCPEFQCPSLLLDCPAGTTLFAQPLHFPDDGWTLGVSDQGFPYKRYENFSGVSGEICDVHWWGGEMDGSLVNCTHTNVFEISFWDNVGGQPGTMVCGPYQVSPSRVSTGLYYHTSYQILAYEYSTVVPCCALTDGFVSIYGLGDGLCRAWWLSGFNGDSYHCAETVPGSGAYVCGDPDNNFDFSVCLTGEYVETYGACCDDETGICNDGIEMSQCLAPLRFAANTLCADLDPPCGLIPGACCEPDGACFVALEDDCVDPNTYMGDWTDCDPNPCPQPSPCDDAIYDAGRPDGTNGFASDRRTAAGDLEGWVVDDVVFTTPVVITDLHWWAVTDDSYIFANTDDFIILEDAGGAPGAVIMEEWDVPNYRTATGNVWFSRPEYIYSIDGLNIPLAPGTYWIGMRPVNQGVLGQNFWLTAPNDGTGQAYFKSVYFGYPDWTPGVWGDFSAMAFCVTGTLGEAFGACCDDTTGICVDNVPVAECPPPLRFAMDTLCADLDPPCGMINGACCYPDGSCVVTEADDCVDPNVYMGDGTVCDPNPCPSPGDDCNNTASISVPGSDANTTCGRGDVYRDTCLGLYDGGEDMMYEFVLSAETCINAYLSADTDYLGLAIDDSCPLDPTTCLGSNTCGYNVFETSIEALTLQAGTYYIQVDTWEPPDCITNFDLTITLCPTGGACCLDDGSCVDVGDEAECDGLGGAYQGEGTACAPAGNIVCPQPNDDCEDAIGPLGIPSSTFGTTTGMTDDHVDPPCGFSSAMHSNAWYTVTGTGNTMTASVCNAFTGIDTKMSVYCLGCTELLCVGGNDDECDPHYWGASTVEFCSQAGVEYLVSVGMYSTTTQGDFQLDISDDGTPCTPTVICIPPEGACCDAAPGPGCTDGLIEEDCDAAGGTWAGADTTCDDPDCNDNGQNDFCDFAQGISEDCNNNGIPDECDIADGTSEDCQPDGIPDECQLANGGRAVLWDNGPFMTDPGIGCNGDDVSILCTAIGGSVWGYGAQLYYGYRIADDFTFDSACTIDSIRVYAYQTGAPGAGSTLTAVNMQIWDASPMAGGSVIWGDTSTNIMTATDTSGIWRASDTTPANCDRNVKYADVNIGGLALNPGTYWIDYQFDGTLSSGPWAPPVTLPCTAGTGNALQYTTAWAPVTDTGSGWPEDFPFIIEGNCGPLENDCNGNGIPDECDEPVCGNNCIEGGAGQYPDDEEDCDGDLDDACPGECYPPGSQNECMCPFCGDGVLGDDEECDDGNNDPCDGCDAECRIEECGNDRVDCGEECDDGNTTPCDGCDELCRIEACGNGRVECDEECDDGNNVDGDGCSAQCIIEFCGDGIVQVGLGEQCDDGNNEDEDGCNAQCQVEYCGDGVLQEGLGEECDDGNIEPGDGCDENCLDEAPEAIPTVSTWGLLILALLLLVAGKVYFGRRRARASA